MIFFGVLLAMRVGRGVGERAITRYGSIGSTIGSLEAAVFALLGLMIAFTFSVALAIVAALLAGYQSAGEKGYAWIHKIAFATIVALTVYVIFEIEYPRLGLVRIDGIDHLLVDVRAGMK